MAGRPGHNHKLGNRVLNDRATRENYLSKLREKNGRNEAARLMGLNPATVWRYVQENPDFLLEIQEAEAAKVEQAHKFWFDVMENEELPLKDRLRASELLQKTFGRETRKDSEVVHRHQHELVVSGDQMERVLAMQRRLELEAGSIEVTVTDESETA